MRKLYVVTLTADERSELRELIAKGKAAAYKMRAARILLKADTSQGERWTDEEIAEAVEVSVRTVERTRESLVKEGLAVALSRKPQKNHKKRIVDGDVEAQLTVIACSTPPEGQARWSLRLLAEKLVERRIVGTISHETVRKALKKTN